MKEIKKRAILTCPKCGIKQEVEMPTNACQHFYKCINCAEILKPKEGDCCVFCSYADSKCPPKQLEELSKNNSPEPVKRLSRFTLTFELLCHN